MCLFCVANLVTGGWQCYATLYPGDGEMMDGPKDELLNYLNTLNWSQHSLVSLLQTGSYIHPCNLILDFGSLDWDLVTGSHGTLEAYLGLPVVKMSWGGNLRKNLGSPTTFVFCLVLKSQILITLWQPFAAVYHKILAAKVAFTTRPRVYRYDILMTWSW